MKGLVGLSKCEWITYSRILRVEIVSPPGFEPATYRSRSRHTNHSATAPHSSPFLLAIAVQVLPKPPIHQRLVYTAKYVKLSSSKFLNILQFSSWWYFSLYKQSVQFGCNICSFNFRVAVSRRVFAIVNAHEQTCNKIHIVVSSKKIALFVSLPVK